MLSVKSKRQLAEALSEYDGVNPTYDDVFNEAGERIRLQGHATKYDLAVLLFWKGIQTHSFRANLLNLPTESVTRVTADAFAPDLDDGERCDRLRELPGFANKTAWAVPSTLLTAWNPTKFGIYDTRAWDALKSLGVGMPNTLPLYFRLLRDLSTELGWTPRAVDKALYRLGKRTRGRPSLGESE